MSNPRVTGAKGIFSSDIQDATGGYLLATDDFFGRSDRLIPVGGCLFFHFGEASVESVQEVIGTAPVVVLKVDIIGFLTAFKEHMSMKFQMRRSLPAEHKVGHDGRCIVVVVDVIMTVGVQFLVQAKVNEV